MNNAIVSKLFGWSQFIATALATVFSNGLPTNTIGWVSVLGSLATAIGVHAASSTDGAK